jgi:glutaminase
VLDSFHRLRFLILDLKHVLAIDESACRLLLQLGTRLSEQNRSIVFSRTGHLPLLRRYMKAKLGAQFESTYQVFADNDLALEWCENKWLQQQSAGAAHVQPVALESNDLFRDLTSEELKVITDRLVHRSYREGEVVVEIGAKAEEIFLIYRGSAAITIPLANGAQRRLGVFSAGMAFGEVAMLDGAPRSAVVKAETDLECYLLKRNNFEALDSDHPRIKVTLLRNMALGLARLLRKATREVGVFDY